MRDPMRTGTSPIDVLRTTLATLGFGKENGVRENAEQWTAPGGRCSVTIHAGPNSAPAPRNSHRIGNLKIFELPPGATVDDRYVRLSPAEISILVVLARAQKRYVRLIDLSNSVNAGAAMSLRALTVHVHGLRRKLAENRSSARIATKRTLGYMLTTDEEPNRDARYLMYVPSKTTDHFLPPSAV
jgi:DNA-binding response OmpR family regulator